jgi:hypothetical protein
MSEPTIICTRWRAIERNTLRGFCDLHLTRARLTIRDCTYHEGGDGKAWIGLPSKPKIRDGAVVLKDGRPEYEPPLVSIDEDAREKFREAAVAAVKAKMAEAAPAK